MKTIEKGGHFICYDSYNLENNENLNNFLNSEILKELLDQIKEKVIVVLGGDGTILRAIRENYVKDIPFLGINFGTKGFLLNDKAFIRPGFNYEKRKYPLLDLKIKKESKLIEDVAVNEVDIRSNTGRIVDLDINISNKGRLNIEGDGVIISTPAGSTGYNSSLGGPIVPHVLDLFVITPKAAWKPKGQAPIILNSKEQINIENNGRKNEIVINSDGRQVIKTNSGEKIKIEIEKSKNQIELIISQEYIKSWDNKVLSEQGFNV